MRKGADGKTWKGEGEETGGEREKKNSRTIDPASPPAIKAKPMNRNSRAIHVILTLLPEVENENESPLSDALSMQLILYLKTNEGGGRKDDEGRKEGRNG